MFVDAAEFCHGDEKGFVYAVMAYGEDRRLAAHVVGRCPSWVVPATAAEAWAILQALRSASLGVWLHSDAARAIDAVERLRFGLMPPM